MTRALIQIGVVLTGYVLAAALAWGAVCLHEATINQTAASAASGMYAFGDLILFVGVFGLAGIVPTGLGLFFLGVHRWFLPKRVAVRS